MRACESWWGEMGGTRQWRCRPPVCLPPKNPPDSDGEFESGRAQAPKRTARVGPGGPSGQPDERGVYRTLKLHRGARV
jgi:hypothetical protein